jgi:hypothetical protein
MISILAQRPPADTPGQDIVEPLLTAEQAAVERARIEIDRECTNRAIHTCTGPLRQFVAPGTLVEYQGRRQVWRGLVRRCALTLTRDDDAFSADIGLEVEREL